MLTNNCTTYGTMHPCFYCVIIKVSDKNQELPVMFKITTDTKEIIDFFNNCPPFYSRWLFSSLDEAKIFLDNKLSFQDKFIFQIEDNQYVLPDHWYIRE